MATITSITVAQFQSALVAVSTAVSTGDYAGAHVEVLNAEVALAGLPLTNVKEGLTAQMRANLKAVTEADLVWVSTPGLLNKIKQLNPSSVLVRNVLAPEIMHSAFSPVPHSATIAARGGDAKPDSDSDKTYQRT